MDFFSSREAEQRPTKYVYPQHVLDLILLKQQRRSDFFSYCYENYEICVL